MYTYVQFDRVYWRSLRNAPPCAEWLAGAIPFLSGQQVLPADGEEARLRQFLDKVGATASAQGRQALSFLYR